MNASQELVHNQATLAAAMVIPDDVDHLDPALIVGIFTIVTNAIIECRKSKGGSAETAHAEAMAAYEANPRWSRKNIRKRIERAARRNYGLRLRRQQSESLTEAYITQGLAADRMTMATACATE